MPNYDGGMPEIFERVASAPVVPPRLPLVILLTGFTDAGATFESSIGNGSSDTGS